MSYAYGSFGVLSLGLMSFGIMSVYRINLHNAHAIAHFIPYCSLFLGERGEWRRQAIARQQACGPGTCGRVRGQGGQEEGRSSLLQVSTGTGTVLLRGECANSTVQVCINACISSYVNPGKTVPLLQKML